MLMVISVISAYTAFISRRTELNTNSMKDELVTATKKMSHAQGKLAGIVTEKASEKKRLKDLQ